MVGRSSSTRLRSLGITTIGELAHTDKDFLMREFKSHGLLMWDCLLYTSVSEKEDIMALLQAGAVSVSSTNQDTWFI